MRRLVGAIQAGWRTPRELWAVAQPAWFAVLVWVAVSCALQAPQAFDVLTSVALDHRPAWPPHLVLLASFLLPSLFPFSHRVARGQAGGVERTRSRPALSGLRGRRGRARRQGCVLRFQLPKDAKVRVPLGWMLSDRARRAMDDQIGHDPNVGFVGRILTAR